MAKIKKTCKNRLGSSKHDFRSSLVFFIWFKFTENFLSSILFSGPNGGALERSENKNEKRRILLPVFHLLLGWPHWDDLINEWMNEWSSSTNDGHDNESFWPHWVWLVWIWSTCQKKIPINVMMIIRMHNQYWYWSLVCSMLICCCTKSENSNGFHQC